MIRIVVAAIRFRGVVFTGVRHGFILKQMVEVGFLTNENKPVRDSQMGFVDERGDFWDRTESREIAIVSGQVQSDHGTLYSEDLW